MNICIFDTETTSLEKPFCYNIGYIIYNTDLKCILKAKDFVVEQIWHNLPLFQSAYYADKRPLYIERMRARKVIMEKFGYITQEMIRNFKRFNVSSAYAYNSAFDEKVFEYNCNWFKVINPFDNIPIFDIRSYVHQFISNTEKYIEFCETNELFTDSLNYSTTAESVYKFLQNDINFVEEHTALSDSIIELSILSYCIDNGANYEQMYTTYRSIVRSVSTPFQILVNNELIYDGEYVKKYIRKNIYKFTV